MVNSSATGRTNTVMSQHFKPSPAKKIKKRARTINTRVNQYRSKQQYAKTLKMVNNYLISDKRYNDPTVTKAVKQIKKRNRYQQRKLRIKRGKKKPLNIDTKLTNNNTESVAETKDPEVLSPSPPS